jgi:D-alanine-D-alanine ligase
MKHKSHKIAVLLGDPTLPDTVKKNGQFNEEDFTTIVKLKEALESLEGFQFHYLNHHADFGFQLEKIKPALALNLCDEGYNNDPLKELHVTALLEMLNIPYTGAGPSCLALCYNKANVRAVAQNMGIPVPNEIYIAHDDDTISIPAMYPALVKPNLGDSSVGITANSLVHNTEELQRHINFLKEILPGKPILVQEFLSGTEYSVGLIGNPGQFEVLPIIEVDYSRLDPGLPKILAYESKWDPESPYWDEIRYKPAKLESGIRKRLTEYSQQLFERTGCRDYGRVDFRCDPNGEIKLLEVNPNPGWCWDGKLNLMASLAEMSYSQLLEAILNAAILRARV